MRLAILADVHANLPALTRALDLLASDEVDGYVCAGDLVGYGPQPNECVNAIETLGATCVAGNHDLLATGRLPAERIGALARTSLRWTARGGSPSSTSSATATAGCICSKSTPGSPSGPISARARE